MKLRRLVLAVGIVQVGTQSAHAWHFDCRFIERVGAQDVVLPSNTIDASGGEPRNIRIQFGVFGDENGPAPAGGFISWQGSLRVTGEASNSDERRNPGRLGFWRDNGCPQCNGFPLAPPNGPDNPWDLLTPIAASHVYDALAWNGCVDPDGDGVFEPAPMPPPRALGHEDFVSIFAFTIDPAPGATSYQVIADGRLIGVGAWQVLDQAPPDCSDPMNPIPGVTVYTPRPDTIVQQLSFSCALNVVVPAPAGVGMLVCAGVMVGVRRGRAVSGVYDDRRKEIQR